MSYKKTGWLALVAAVLLFTGVSSANAAIDPDKLQADLNNLVIQGRSIVTSMNSTTLSTSNIVSNMASLQTNMAGFSTAVGALHAYLTIGDGSTGSFSLTPQHLLALQNLSTIISSITTGTSRLSGQATMLAPGVFPTSLNTSFNSMLRLSDDIGLMANRILEMSDKILIMADNIGEMADRILITQMIQSNNLALVVNATLLTQQNAILMMDKFIWF